MRLLKWLPVDRRLCCGTVTVYHREGLTRQVLEGVHFEWTDKADAAAGMEQRTAGFLLVVPYEADIRPGDKLVKGEGAEAPSWAGLNVTAGAYTVRSVKRRDFLGRFCHLEARGE